MVSKCANTGCSVPFRYLRSGKLFRVEAGLNPGASEPSEAMFVSRKPMRRAQFFWLCSECALKVRLVTSKEGIVAEPLPRSHAAAAGS
jgi:hypothetical protein